MSPNKWPFVLIFCAIGSHSFAQDDTQSLPAVDGINYKYSGGFVGGRNNAKFVTGSVTFPIGHRFGLQIDGVGAEVSTNLYGNVPVYAAAAHAFWRDPEIGLLGMYGDYARVDLGSGYDVYTAGVSGAIFLDRFSVDAVVGAQRINQFDLDFFNEANLNFYPSNDVKLHIGHSQMLGVNSFQTGVEWVLPNQGRVATSLFAQGALHEGGRQTFEMGIRSYFGHKKKSLIRRHREDDPNVVINAPGLVEIPIHSDGNYTIIIGETYTYSPSLYIYKYYLPWNK